jgi:heme/copper-type cytochrome/quinol oxidase subunit 3
MSARIVGDLSDLPAGGFRQHGMWFWAGLGFMLIEGMGFVLAIAAYLYIMAGANQWPLNEKAPDLLWGTANLVLLLASLVPNWLTSRAARRRDKPATTRWVGVMTLIAVAALALRALEFPHLNARWDRDAYGSVLWALIVMHTAHLITDFLDTFFLAVFLRTHPVDNERLSDADDNAGYWDFIVLWWVPLYALIYWAPRWTP